MLTKAQALTRQCLLRINGFDCGHVDMVWGPKSRYAWNLAKKMSDVNDDDQLEKNLAEVIDTRLITPLGYCAIVYFEIGSPPLGKASLVPTVVPSAASGVTIGIGYDLAYEVNVQRILRKYVHDERIRAVLSNAVGLKGSNAKAAIAGKKCDISLGEALSLFENVTLPDLRRTTESVFPRGTIPEDAFAMLMSLVYNRGPSIIGPRRKEMAEIHRICKAKTGYDKIPKLLTDMINLWPDTLSGLRKRRALEAEFFAEALERQRQ